MSACMLYTCMYMHIGSSCPSPGAAIATSPDEAGRYQSPSCYIGTSWRRRRTLYAFPTASTVAIVTTIPSAPKWRRLSRSVGLNAMSGKVLRALQRRASMALAMVSHAHTLSLGHTRTHARTHTHTHTHTHRPPGGVLHRSPVYGGKLEELGLGTQCSRGGE